ncbi:MAG: DUF2207 domain-containing protein [Rhodobiaceae bacterium]|nr:DUF2207 domain-containing protein [Rhodobiaceae bacterium]MCC0054802.1 DUF2207 domain-containing protein [Rhodobiaceae bacterium]
MRRLLAALLFCLAVAAAAPAFAREEILSFDVDVTVQTDGDLLVEENIVIRAEANQIRHGIYRDIPIGVMDDRGLWTADGFDLLGVQQDGKESPFHTRRQGRFLRIYIGDADTDLSPGVYAYTIFYRMSGQIRFFDGFDEIYWNATGTYWSFPILGATARVHLPEGAVAQQVAAYTGARGDNGSAYVVSGGGTRTVSFRTTSGLAPGEGLTVAVGFTKGVVTKLGRRADLVPGLRESARVHMARAVFHEVCLQRGQALSVWNVHMDCPCALS